MSAPRKRRRRTASIATVLAGAIAALMVQCVSQNKGPQSEPETSQAANSQRAPELEPSAKQIDAPVNGKADARIDRFYQLVLTITPAFCELNAESALCQASKATPKMLTLHGLWPERLNLKKTPSYCKGPAIDLDAEFDPRLARWMPGPISGSPAYQWGKHGSCSGLKPLRYFSESVDWAERIERAILPLLTNSKAYASADFKARASHNLPAYGEAPALGSAISLHCQRVKMPTGTHSVARQSAPHLLEIRVCLSSGSDSAPAQLVECAALDRIDQGCGKQFWIDS